jgi:hypothetical protein
MLVVIGDCQQWVASRQRLLGKSAQLEVRPLANPVKRERRQQFLGRDQSSSASTRPSNLLSGLRGRSEPRITRGASLFLVMPIRLTQAACNFSALMLDRALEAFASCRACHRS